MWACPWRWCLPEAGFHIDGDRPDLRKVDCLNQGVSYIPDVKTEAVEKLARSGHLAATTDFSVLKEMDAVSICVPTLRQTGDPDMSFILSATEELAKYMHPGMVVVLNQRLIPAQLVNCSAEVRHRTWTHDWRGLVPGVSPERVDPGRKDWTTVNTPKVMGGITEVCGEVATIWYEGDPAST